ncbi:MULTISPECIES: PAS domain S-box protein [unclassified Variovorax]|uniref:PAS domain S-box protein n=1 Tax=unclassified Variovorax TaxID=663243 RepID=UPI00076CCDC2|nr:MULTISPECIES: PAS domain S-box protein [unclassified Variovorax]KWT89270.1 PAS/PAC sensor hybrid histidine kinase [Variovorax sp. WDL1]PNG46827.1 Blue-light-activated protein [Variovorax sp. B2]PNG48522.1 Blue-light-activated protein [Variovorax sp. B4]VTV14645.1 Blue-light-activated protein [Variovorax sp. WDL1]
MQATARNTSDGATLAALSGQLQSLRRVALAVAHPGGPGLFDALVRELAEALAVPTVFIAVFSDDVCSLMQTVAVRLDGRALKNFDYVLQGTPCAHVVGREFRYVSSGVAAEFPRGSLFAAKGMDSYAAFPMRDSQGEALGLLVAMDRVPIAGGDAEHAEAMLKIVAGRAAAEIERTRTDEALRSAALAVSGARSGTVFDELVRLLAAILRVEVAFIARRAEDEPRQLTMLAIQCDGQVLHDIRYAIAGTPCETVLGQQFRAYPNDLQAQFPEDEDAKTQGTVSYAGYPLTALDGTPLGVVSIASRRPLTQVDRVESMLKIFAMRAAAEVERLAASEALQHSEASYRTIFETAEDAIFVHDWDSDRFIDVNSRACETFGYTHEELIRLSVADVSSGVPPYTAEDARRWIELAKQGHCPSFEWQRRNKDGSLHWDEVRLKPATFNGRRHILAFTRDITERRERERALQRSEARLRATVEAAFDCVIGMDAEGRIVEFNAAAERVFGYRREAVMGRPVAEVIVPERRREAHLRWLREFPITGSGPMLGRLVESTALTASGDEIPVELAVSVAEAPEGNIFVGHVRDISARREAEAARLALEAQLRQAQKMEAIGQLTGGIAHDFNNILTSVIGYLVLGEERAEATGDAVLLRQLGQAHLAAQRARDLIAQMLAFARRQRGEARVLDVAPLVRQTLRLLRATLPSSVTLDGNAGVDDMAASPLCVAVDPVQLEQVLFNLCINARDALDGAGRISVHLLSHAQERWQCASCRAPVDGGPWVELSVADSGSGIAPELQERIFDPFFSTKAPGSGSGMGLAMVHGIVHGHGGHLRLRTARGVGSVFSVMLPRAATAPAAAPEPAPHRMAGAPALRGSVLVVEDDPMVGDFLVERLASWGLRVRLQREPQTAAAWLAEPAHETDLLVTDQTMPHMTGLQLAAHARALRPTLPVVLVSGNAGGFDPQELARCGVHALLRKPIDAERLRAVLREVLAATV